MSLAPTARTTRVPYTQFSGFNSRQLGRYLGAYKLLADPSQPPRMRRYAETLLDQLRAELFHREFSAEGRR